MTFLAHFLLFHAQYNNAHFKDKQNGDKLSVLAHPAQLLQRIEPRHAAVHLQLANIQAPYLITRKRIAQPNSIKVRLIL